MSTELKIRFGFTKSKKTFLFTELCEDFLTKWKGGKKRKIGKKVGKNVEK